jgi:hypothetical protein
LHPLCDLNERHFVLELCNDQTALARLLEHLSRKLFEPTTELDDQRGNAD